MTHQITGALFKDMIINGAAAIDNHKSEINELNVFPVPDGDTGTNMSLTMSAAAAALKDVVPGSIGKTAELTASALLRGARGNSGVILSLLFRGIARHLKDLETADSLEIAHAISFGVDSAYKAVMKPAEGTILTVSRLAAGAAVSEAEHTGDIEAVLEQALIVGYEALANTINQNPVLKRAGVVDAGGKGYLLILDGMLKALRGEQIQKSAAATEGREQADFAGFDTEEITFTYCTEFIVSRQASKDVAQLRQFLDERGDSIVVVDDDEVIKVHVHSNEPGVIITEALTYGPLITIKVENMKEQHTGKVVEGAAKPVETGANSTGSAPADEPITPALPEKEIGVVAVCAGEGMSTVFHDLGVDNIIVGGQTMNPSTEDILTKIQATPAETVFVLPNNKNIIMAAQQCVPLTDKKVIVIPTRTMPQGISALIALDAGATPEENTETMTAAAKRVHTVQITYAARDSVFDGKEIHSGDYLALLEDTLIATGADVPALIDTVTASLAAFSPEFITVFSGEDANDQLTAEIQSRLSAAVPGAEISAVDGGQPVYCYLISAE